MQSKRVFPCLFNKDKFCYVCGEYYLKRFHPFSDKVETLYLKCFNFPALHYNKIWAPSKVCHRCYQMIEKGANDPKHLLFNIPLIWTEPTHPNNCLFCLVDMSGRNSLSRKQLNYPNIDSAIRPKLTDDFANSIQIDSKQSESSSETDNDQSDDFNVESSLISTEKLSDMIKNLRLSKNDAVSLGQMLKSEGCLNSSVKLSNFKKRDLEFRDFFSIDTTSVFCNDIK